MSWNEPDKGSDPWGGRSKQQPPDLEEAFKRFNQQFKRAFSGKKTPPNGADPKDANNPGFFLGLMGLLIFMLWFLSGIFIVDPAEQAAILRLGKYIETVGPGPHWIPRFIESKVVANVERVSDYSYAAQMLTKDENLVAVALVVQYKIGDLQEYLFNVADPEESLRQATSSALRQVVGNTRLDQIITEGREAWGSSVQETLIKILAGYKAGIKIVNVSPQPARAPENVQDAFDDAIKAQEDEKRFKEQARAYEASVVPIAEGNAKRILEESKAFETQVVLRAEGEVAEYLALLPEYIHAPQVMRTRMYLDTMQQVLAKTSKIVVDSKANNMLYLPLEKWMGEGRPEMKNATSTPPLQMQTHPIEQQANQLLSGRDTTRPLEPMGRVES